MTDVDALVETTIDYFKFCVKDTFSLDSVSYTGFFEFAFYAITPLVLMKVFL